MSIAICVASVVDEAFLRCTRVRCNEWSAAFAVGLLVTAVVQADAYRWPSLYGKAIHSSLAG